METLLNITPSLEPLKMEWRRKRVIRATVCTSLNSTQGGSQKILCTAVNTYLRIKAVKEPKVFLQHFGDECKIASPYMEKTFNSVPVKSEDVKGLQSFSLFLRGCSNLTEQVMYMRELDLPSNMQSIILKIPYKLREKWRNVACDLQERRQRATFTDLVNFIERQVKIAWIQFSETFKTPNL